MSARDLVAIELRGIRQALVALGERVDELERRLQSSGSSSFEWISGGAVSELEAPSTPVASHSPAGKGYSKGPPGPVTARQVSPEVDEQIRTEAAIETGRFFARCLTGRSRGLSGRNRVQLPNQVYVVIRGVKGELYTEPVRLFYSFREARAIVADSSGRFGDAIFAGFASVWEARLAVGEAGLGFPGAGDW